MLKLNSIPSLKGNVFLGKFWEKRKMLSWQELEEEIDTT